jgi:phage terminase large subunit
MKSGHIQFAWENIITKKIQKENYSSLAFNISHEDNSIKSILSNTVINLMVENNIRVKEIGKVDISDITNVCFNNEVETILSVDVSNETIQIKLFDKNSSILVSYLLPYSSSVFSIN